MQGIGLREIQQWTDAQVVGIFDPVAYADVGGISTDSRTLRRGELFLALRGERFDGHDHVHQALQAGAVAAVVESDWAQVHGASVSAPLLAVSSTLGALGDIAREYRRRFDLPVIGVTGSAGKTTTKEMIAAVLGTKYQVLKSDGNENNEIGVPKTLLRLDATHQVAVLELAARRVGDIAFLCSVAQPTVGVLLNVGTAHLQFFESVERVAKAKGELLGYLHESSTALINVDDRVVAREAKRTKGRLLGFGLRRESEFRGERLVLDQKGCGHFSLQHIPFALQIPGRHNVYNALAAAGVGRILGVPWDQIRTALEAFTPLAMRSALQFHAGWTLLDDSYNANPDSLSNALELLASVQAQRRIAVLGDMLELGSQSVALHAAVGPQVVAAGVDLLLTTGELSRHTAAAARQAGMPAGQVHHFPDREQMTRYLHSCLGEGDAVLVKASRAMRLDEVAASIRR